MTVVKNLLPNRAVAVRDDKDRLIKIGVGHSAEVKGFDTKDPFHAGLIEMGHIQVGGGKVTQKDDGATLQAALEAAERKVSNARDLAQSTKDAFEADKNAETRAAAQAARQALKVAEDEYATAKADFDRG